MSPQSPRIPAEPDAPHGGRLIIFDTTLRDGEQSPGCSMNLGEKLQVARALARLGVDVIEAGFPIASPGDFEAVQAIARAVEGPTICGLARCIDADIDRAWEAVRDALRPRIHVFLATSAIHREAKLNMGKAEIVKHARRGVERARGLCDDIEFSPEDAARTEPDFLAEVVEAAIDAGATTINIPDTVGYTTPDEFRDLISHLRRTVRGMEKVTLSVHCHDDLGLAVANSLAAVQAGARQVECTINGIGERAGNCALEELVMAVRTRGDRFGAEVGIDTTRLYPTSRLVASVTKSPVQRNKAVVGENAFAHEAGIHQHGVLKNRATYEIMRPEDVGFSRNALVLGKHSGRHALRAHIERLGFDVTEAQLGDISARFKELADRKKTIYDADIEALVMGDAPSGRGWRLRTLQTTGGTHAMATAAIELEDPAGGEVIREASCGDGPVDAVFKAITRAADLPLHINDYKVRSVTIGEDAQGEVIVEIEHDGQPYRGRGLSTDIIEASALAILDVVNRLLRLRGRPGSEFSVAAIEVVQAAAHVGAGGAA